MGAIIVTNACWDGTMTYLSMASYGTDHKTTFGHLMQDPMWKEGNPVYFTAKFVSDS